MRTLNWRVVEVKMLRRRDEWRVDAYLLIQGVGKPVHFEIQSTADLEGELNKAIEEAYQQVTGKALG